MLRLALLSLLVSACTTAEPFETTVEWTTETPPTNPSSVPAVTARIHYFGPTGEFIDAHGYNNNAVISGESLDPTVEFCLQIGQLESPDHEGNICNLVGDCDSSPEFVGVTEQQCQTVASDTDRVTFAF